MLLLKVKNTPKLVGLTANTATPSNGTNGHAKAETGSLKVKTPPTAVITASESTDGAHESASKYLEHVRVNADATAPTGVLPPKPAVKDVFETLEYGPAPEDDKPAHAWLEAHSRKFGIFVNNKVSPYSRSLCPDDFSGIIRKERATTKRMLPLTERFWLRASRLTNLKSTLQLKLQRRHMAPGANFPVMSVRAISTA